MCQNQRTLQFSQARPLLVTIDDVPYGIPENKVIVGETEGKADSLNTWAQNGNSA